MEINRQSLQSHVSHAAQSLRQAASRAAGPMEEKRIAERGYALEAFEDKLERTSGQNSLEISQTSQARATSRLKTGVVAGLALGTAATLGVRDRDLPTSELELIVHEPGAVHRLDRRPHPLTTGPRLFRQRPQTSRVWR